MANNKFELNSINEKGDEDNAPLTGRPTYWKLIHQNLDVAHCGSITDYYDVAKIKSYIVCRYAKNTRQFKSQQK